MTTSAMTKKNSAPSIGPEVEVCAEDTIGDALAVSLDKSGQEAFDRLAGGLPVLASEAFRIAPVLDDLAKTFVSPGANAPEGYSLGDAFDDLDTVVGQVSNDEFAEVLRTRKADLSTTTLATSGGLLQPAQGDEIEETPAPFKGKFKILSKAESKSDDDEERTVFGIVLEPEVVDSQDDIYSAEEIEKTAWRFMERYQQFGLMHEKIVSAILPLESYIAPVDFEVNGIKVKKGTWLLRVRVQDDDIWAQVKSGELTGFSIGGSAMRTPDKITVAA